MKHRNKKLVYTDSDCEDDDNHNKKRKIDNSPTQPTKRQKLNGGTSKIHPRRSRRLALKYNSMNNEPDSDEEDKMDIESNQEEEDQNSFDESDDGMNDFIVDDEMDAGLTQSGLPIRNFMNLLGKKPTVGDYLDIIKRESWFKELSANEKKKYLDKMEKLVTYPHQIPSIKDIMDADLGRISTKLLINERMELDEADKLSPNYDDECSKLIRKMEYLKNTREEQKQIVEIEEKILDDPKFYRSLRERILSSEFSNEIKAIIYNKYLKMEESGEHDAPKYQIWIETVLSLPHHPKKIELDETVPRNIALSKLMFSMMQKLNQKVYGMQTAKEELLCIVANMFSNPKSKNKAIGLYGPPGIGKTMIVKILAEVLDRPMELISLGGMTDSSYLEGHDFTYIGSQPGRIVRSLINMKCTNGILFFDELDKISKNPHNGKEVEHCLLHITDFTQNHNYRDKYMPEIPIDLSDCIFIYSMNSKNELDMALASRIPMVQFDGYDAKEKVVIVSDYLLPEILENYGINKGEVILPKSTIEYLISIVKEEGEVNGKSGVRGLKKALNNIINRVNLYRLASVNGKLIFDLSFQIKDFAIPFTITNGLVDQIIQKETEPYPHLYL